MLKLPAAIAAWQTPDFVAALKNELAQLGVKQLPLQQALSASSYALDDELDFVIMQTTDSADCIKVNLSVFYYGVMAGCGCADDPSPLDRQNEHCEIMLTIDKRSAEATIHLLS